MTVLVFPQETTVSAGLTQSILPRTPRMGGTRRTAPVTLSRRG